MGALLFKLSSLSRTVLYLLYVACTVIIEFFKFALLLLVVLPQVHLVIRTSKKLKSDNSLSGPAFDRITYFSHRLPHLTKESQKVTDLVLSYSFFTRNFTVHNVIYTGRLTGVLTYLILQFLQQLDGELHALCTNIADWNKAVNFQFYIYSCGAGFKPVVTGTYWSSTSRQPQCTGSELPVV